MTHYDAIIIGAGLNGLTAAATLGKAGLKTLVVERRELIGGTAVTEELIPGYQVDTLTSGITWLPRHIAADLALDKHGLEVLWSDATVFSPRADGPSLTLWHDQARSMEAVRAHSAHDAERLPEFERTVGMISALMERVYRLTPPDVVNGGLADLLPYAEPALDLRMAGSRNLFAVLRALPMPIKDWLDEWFESDLLKGTLAAAGINNLMQGPMSVGTVYTFLHHHVGLPGSSLRASGQVRGGMGKLAAALAEAARANGAEMRSGAEVAQVLVDDECRATGIRLASGEEITARVVASSADPRRTLIGMVDATYLEPHFIRQVRNIRYKGARARVHLALGGLPKFTGLDGDETQLRGIISLSPDVMTLEWAYDDAKHGRISARPYLEAHIPTLAEPGRAPAGKHLMSVSFQFAPYQLREGEWDEAARSQVLDTTVAMLEEVAPGFEGLVEASKVITPVDIEQTYGLTEGALYQGEMMLDQALFMRPVAGWGQYRTPIEGLYLCGSGSHPGGGTAGACGANAAREMVKALRR